VNSLQEVKRRAVTGSAKPINFHAPANFCTVNSQLSGAAKFPYLSLECASLDLGRVAVGRTSSAQLRVANLSPVQARFSVEPWDAAAMAGLVAAAGLANGGSDGREADDEAGVFDVDPKE
jgi:hypothetical protein